MDEGDNMSDLIERQTGKIAKDTNVPSTDCISRQAVIDLLKQMRKDGEMVPWEGKDVFARIRKLPATQPDVPDTNVGDTISRQAAIDAPFKKFDANTGVTWIPLEYIEQLPSAGPEIIRCKDCKNWKPKFEAETVKLGTCSFHNANYVTSKGYCYWAERRTE